MLEKLSTPGYESWSVPRQPVLECVRRAKATRDAVSVAEFGIGIGGTSSAIRRLLSPADTLYLFDFEENAQELKADFLALPGKGPRIKAYGNSHQLMDSYAWSLGQLLLASPEPMLDVAFLDGVHSLVIDGFACCCLKQLLRPGGFLLLDDTSLTLRQMGQHHPEMVEQLQSAYTPTQLDLPQIQMTAECLLERDPQFQRLSLPETEDMAVYQKQ